jgi:hypothetical protein
MYKIVIGLLIIGLVGLFVVKGPDGERLLTLDDFTPDLSTPESLSDLLNSDRAGEQPEPTRVYKRKDENGVWQFSNLEEDSVGAEVIELDGDVNIIPAIDVDAHVADEARDSISRGSQTALPFAEALDGLDKARKLQQTVDSRKADVDKALGN